MYHVPFPYFVCCPIAYFTAILHWLYSIYWIFENAIHHHTTANHNHHSNQKQYTNTHQFKCDIPCLRFSFDNINQSNQRHHCQHNAANKKYKQYSQYQSHYFLPPPAFTKYIIHPSQAILLFDASAMIFVNGFYHHTLFTAFLLQSI